MTISNEAYKALEGIVGATYISQEPADMDSYSFVWGNELFFEGKFSTRPFAAILPESTEEVQAIVKTCNQFGLKFRAHASGFEVTALTSDTPIVSIDLRRMNRIVEIDSKNKFAVVEPYVSQAKLFLETRKLGLRPLMLSSGPSCSVLAGCAAHFGSGASSISTDYGCRNLLGLEWVLPDGDILRLGSLGSSGEWINADGPGPSLRGLVRGYGGANGGNGIFTKVATKIYPWYGQDETCLTGKGPQYINEIPENFDCFVLFFPDIDKWNDFNHLVHEASIAYHFQRVPLSMFLGGTLNSNDETYALLSSVPKEEMDTFGQYAASIALDAISKDEMKYKKKVLNKIIEITKGEVFPLDDKSKGTLYNSVLNGEGAVKLLFRPAGSFNVLGTGDEAIDTMGTIGDEAWDKILDEAYNSGDIYNGNKCSWRVSYAEGSGHIESIAMYDPACPETVNKFKTLINKSDHTTAEIRLGMGGLENALSYKEETLKVAMNYKTLDFIKYMKKIKRSIDPNNSADSTFYVSPEEWG